MTSLIPDGAVRDKELADLHVARLQGLTWYTEIVGQVPERAQKLQVMFCFYPFCSILLLTEILNFDQALWCGKL